jgi:hypothetical protein
MEQHHAEQKHWETAYGKSVGGELLVNACSMLGQLLCSLAHHDWADEMWTPCLHAAARSTATRRCKERTLVFGEQLSQTPEARTACTVISHFKPTEDDVRLLHGCLRHH